MRKKILWLVSWYPNKTDPFDGDFIQRHAQAAALYNEIHVIHLVPDLDGKFTSSAKKEIHQNDNLTEEIIYFRKSNSFLGRFTAFLKWKKLYKQAILDYTRKNGLPQLVHVHVPVKAGILALWLKNKFKIEFTVTEHLGIYNKVAEDRYELRPAWFKNLTKKIFRGAAAFTTVSKFLGDGVNKLVMKKPYQIIPNVVNTDLFFYKGNDNPKFRFIHVSNMVPLKNVEGILQAAKQLRGCGNYFELVMIGNRDDSKQLYAQQLGFDGSVKFMGEISHQAVATEMQKANALLLFSDIENSPCVIGEALCCGLPVIASNVGGIPELITKENGILVKPKNIEGLVTAMQEMINRYHQFNREEISKEAKQKFSYPVVGKMFDQLYESVSSQRS